MGSRGGNRVGERWNQMNCEEKSSVIEEEVKRVSKLPSNSVYAVHRLKVLNKINELLSVQRTLSQEKELELLFTQLSLREKKHVAQTILSYLFALILVIARESKFLYETPDEHEGQLPSPQAPDEHEGQFPSPQAPQAPSQDVELQIFPAHE